MPTNSCISVIWTRHTNFTFFQFSPNIHGKKFKPFWEIKENQICPAVTEIIRYKYLYKQKSFHMKMRIENFHFIQEIQSLAKDLANRRTDMVFLQWRFITIKSEGTTTTTLQREIAIGKNESSKLSMFFSFQILNWINWGSNQTPPHFPKVPIEISRDVVAIVN